MRTALRDSSAAQRQHVALHTPTDLVKNLTIVVMTTPCQQCALWLLLYMHRGGFNMYTCVSVCVLHAYSATSSVPRSHLLLPHTCVTCTVH